MWIAFSGGIVIGACLATLMWGGFTLKLCKDNNLLREQLVKFDEKIYELLEKYGDDQ